MKFHLITSIIVLSIVGLVIYILNSPLFLSFIMLGAITFGSAYLIYKLYKGVYRSVKNILD